MLYEYRTVASVQAAAQAPSGGGGGGRRRQGRAPPTPEALLWRKALDQVRYTKNKQARKEEAQKKGEQHKAKETEAAQREEEKDKIVEEMRKRLEHSEQNAQDLRRTCKEGLATPASWK